MKIRLLLILISTVALLLGTSSVAAQEQQPQSLLNGKDVELQDIDLTVRKPSHTFSHKGSPEKKYFQILKFPDAYYVIIGKEKRICFLITYKEIFMVLVLAILLL